MTSSYGIICSFAMKASHSNRHSAWLPHICNIADSAVDHSRVAAAPSLAGSALRDPSKSKSTYLQNSVFALALTHPDTALWSRLWMDVR